MQPPGMHIHTTSLTKASALPTLFRRSNFSRIVVCVSRIDVLLDVRALREGDWGEGGMEGAPWNMVGGVEGMEGASPPGLLPSCTTP